MKRIEIIQGKKVSLVVPEKQDAQVWYEGINNTETQFFLNQFGNILHKETEEEYYESLRKDKSQKTFSIFILEEKKVIGNISLMNIDETSRNAEVGIAIFDTSSQNKGYGTEGMELLMQYAFEILGFHKLHLRAIAHNKRAISVYKKVGFTEIGRQKEQKYYYGKYYDVVFMEIMRNEYHK